MYLTALNVLNKRLCRNLDVIRSLNLKNRLSRLRLGELELNFDLES